MTIATIAVPSDGRRRHVVGRLVLVLRGCEVVGWVLRG